MNARHLTTDDLRGRRWRGLVRESTESQADKWSPERQRADLRRAADELGLIGADPLFYERTGSGEAVGASEVTLALEDAKRGQYDVLLVFHTSRLARNREEAIRVKKIAERIGLVLYFVSQRMISGSRSARLMEGIHEVLDEEANEERRLWIAGGLRERQAAGRWTGRTPLGYRRRMAQFPDGSVRPDGGLAPDPSVAPIVERIFRAAAEGYGPGQIAETLNHRWSPRQVSAIVANPVYKGTLARYRRRTDAHYYPEHDAVDGRREMPGDWPAIVSEQLWQAAQR